ncbi:MAG: hypothetical protein AAF542_05600 [Pseudomonadota bacterium]
MNSRFEAVSAPENDGGVQKLRIKRSGLELTVSEVLECWENDESFQDFYASIFKTCGFESYVWEMPSMSLKTLTDDFECVLLKTPMSSAMPDTRTFSAFFDPHAPNQGVVSFLNLGHDAMLVVPSPLVSAANYSGLANFFDEAPIEQQRALWKVTAQQIKRRVSEKTTWVSVAGGGVSWLHIRLDERPKYYRYFPYAE